MQEEKAKKAKEEPPMKLPIKASEPEEKKAPTRPPAEPSPPSSPIVINESEFPPLFDSPTSEPTYRERRGRRERRTRGEARRYVRREPFHQQPSSPTSWDQPEPTLNNPPPQTH